MKRNQGRELQLVLDDGGPFVIRLKKDREGRRGGLLITTSMCTNPDCDCRDVWLDVQEIEEESTAMELFGQVLKHNAVQKAGESEKPSQMRTLSVRLDIDSGQVDFSPQTPSEHRDPGLLAQLRDGLDANYLARLRKRWRRAKGIEQDRWRRMDWSWWQPGDLVSWLEVFPDDFNLFLEHDGSIYWVDDLYCISPGCGCREVGLVFSRLSTEDGLERMGAVTTALPSCRFVGMMGKNGDERQLRFLTDALRADRELCAKLQGRHKIIRTVGREIARLSSGMGSPETPVEVKVGRNDPCPCGSGKKYKKCCLAKT